MHTYDMTLGVTQSNALGQQYQRQVCEICRVLVEKNLSPMDPTNACTSGPFWKAYVKSIMWQRVSRPTDKLGWLKTRYRQTDSGRTWHIEVQ